MVGVVISLFVTVGLLAPAASAANTNDFSISNYEIDYVLGRDNQKRSTLKTTETITAEFPTYNQNHGIERAIPKSYDGHPTSLKILSVTDQTGNPRNYTTYDSNDNLVVRIGDADRYVHGIQTYVITYQQRDVTQYFSNTGKDEFYWDTNGTEWRVPIDRLSVQLQITDNIRTAVSDGNVFCYQGGAGATGRCEPIKKIDGNYEFQAQNLAANENMTISVGFGTKSFAVYEKSFLERVFDIYFVSIFVIGVLGLGLIAWLIAKYNNWTSRSKELSTIVPEYTPPKDTSITTAASVSTSKGSVFTAQLLDFAVRNYIKIYQTKDRGLLRPAEYDIEIVRDISDLSDEEQEVLRDIFGDAKVGSRLALKSLQNNTTVYRRMSNNDKKLEALTRGSYGIRQQDTAKTQWFKRTGFIILIVAVVMLNPVLFVASIIAFTSGYILWPLTDKGLALSRYLKGLEMYIKVAETDRIKMLQSPEGAQKVGGIDPNDSSQLVKLYERVLPYAVLFGQEKEWNKQIGQIYEQLGSSPSWYSGSNTVFNAAVFSSAMSNFSTAVSYSAASSSSSGGSGGGGSSGGGGGGGGGGGW